MRIRYKLITLTLKNNLLGNLIQLHLEIWITRQPNLRTSEVMDDTFRISHQEIQMQALAIGHLKYWFWISSILETTKNSEKKEIPHLKGLILGFIKFWRLGAWHSYWPATPTLYDKLNFLGNGGVASPWCCNAPVLQYFFFFTIRAFKWDIVCLCSFFTSSVNWVQSSKS